MMICTPFDPANLASEKILHMTEHMMKMDYDLEYSVSTT